MVIGFLFHFTFYHLLLSVIVLISFSFLSSISPSHLHINMFWTRISDGFVSLWTFNFIFGFCTYHLSTFHPILRLLIAFSLYSLLALALSAFVVCSLFYLLLVNSYSLRKYFHWVIFQFKVSAGFLLYIRSEFSVQNSDDLLKCFWLTYLIICVFIFFYWKMGLLHWWTYFWDVYYLDICLFMENIWLIMNLSFRLTHFLPFHTFELVICLSHWKFLSALFFLLSVMNNVFSSYMF